MTMEPGFVLPPKTQYFDDVSSELDQDTLQAIAHGRTALANLGGTHMRGDEYVAVDGYADPAVPKRVESLNLLEALLRENGMPSRPVN